MRNKKTTMRISSLYTGLILMFGLFFMGFAQNAEAQKKALDEADRIFELEQYFSAVDYYKKASKDQATKSYCYYQIAECYRMSNDLQLAEEWYARSGTEGYDEAVYHLNYGHTLRLLEKFDAAIKEYNAYLASKPNDQLVKNDIQGCKNAMAWAKEKTRFTVENMREFNSRNSDYGLVLYKRNGVVFTSDRDESTGKDLYGRTGKKFCDLYEAYVDRRGKWGKPSLIQGGINDKDNEGAGIFDKSGNNFYFTVCANDLKRGGCKIFVARKEGQEWGEPELVSLFEDTVIVGHPAFSPDGKTMYFTALDAPGGLGGRDLYMATGSGKDWSDPVNMGSKLNTEADEMFPYMHRDGKLYFSSNGHPGMGGLDIFSSTGKGSNWATPTNLKAPLNSGADDFGFVANSNKDRGFLSSNRPGGRGNDDIWKWIFEPLVFYTDITIISDSTNLPVPGAEVKLIKKPDNTYVDAISDDEGKVRFRIKEETKYAIQVDKDKYFGNTGKVSTVGMETSKDLPVTVRIAPFPDTTVITLKDILYDLAKATLRPEAFPSLDELAKLLDSSPKLKVGINSHTDSRGTDAANNDLSQRRAQSVVDYLVIKGIEIERLVAKGYGETKLVNRCVDGVECSEEEHQLNRRTEFEILGTDFKTTKIKYKRVTGEEEDAEEGQF